MLDTILLLGGIWLAEYTAGTLPSMLFLASCHSGSPVNVSVKQVANSI